MPHLLLAANVSPPVEIVILDYNSPDDLQEYIQQVNEVAYLEEGNRLTCLKYTGRDYYHMAHARNLSVMAAAGEYFVILSADIYPVIEFVPTVRRLLPGAAWLYDGRYRGVIACSKTLFRAVGGYDERLEFYGPEDRDLDMRLRRLGGVVAELPPGLIKVIQTPDAVKVKNYRLSLSKSEMAQQMRQIFNENKAAGVVEVNPAGWGKWT